MTPSDPETLKKIPELRPSERAALEPTADLESDIGVKETQSLTQDLSAEQLREQAQKNELSRNENFRNHFQIISVCGLWLIAIFFLVVGIAWTWQLITPSSWHWLDAAQTTELRSLLAGGILGGVAKSYISKRLG